MSLEFDGEWVRAFFFSCSCFVSEFVVVVDEDAVVFDANSGVGYFFVSVESGCPECDVICLPLACGFGDELVRFFLAVKASCVAGCVVFWGYSV